jgi:hypothetical protein
VQLHANPVGPLPSAIYWRRRLVLGGILLVALVLLATCVAKGGSDGDSDASKPKGTGQHGETPAPDVPKIQDGSAEHPFYPVPGPPP